MSSIAQTKQGKLELAKAYVSYARDYILNHKAQCAISLTALGVIAYLVNENQFLKTNLKKDKGCEFFLKQTLQNEEKCPPPVYSRPNHWTLMGTPNPTTLAATNTEVCEAIISSTPESILKIYSNFVYRGPGEFIHTFQYTFSDTYTTPLELLIVNNCEASLKPFAQEILDPKLELNVLRSAIVAAAAARNFPLWDELMKALFENENAQEKFNKNVQEVLKQSIKVLDFMPSLPTKAFASYETPYDVPISFQNVRERQVFLEKMFSSELVKSFIGSSLKSLDKRFEEVRNSSDTEPQKIQSLMLEYKHLFLCRYAKSLLPKDKIEVDSSLYPTLNKFFPGPLMP